MFLAKVFVTLKATVNDPQGQTIMGGLKSLGFKSVAQVRAGKYMEIQLAQVDREKAKAQITAMCEKLLSNPIIEEFHFELEDIPASL